MIVPPTSSTTRRTRLFCVTDDASAAAAVRNAAGSAAAAASVRNDPLRETIISGARALFLGGALFGELFFVIGLSGLDLGQIGRAIAEAHRIIRIAWLI